MFNWKPESYIIKATGMKLIEIYQKQRIFYFPEMIWMISGQFCDSGQRNKTSKIDAVRKLRNLVL